MNLSIFAIIVSIIMIIIVLYVYIPWYKLKNVKNISIAKNELSFLRYLDDYGSYSNETKLLRDTISNIINIYKTFITPPKGGVLIESVFNNLYYPVFDIDDFDNYTLFRNIFSPTPYVLMSSSNGHYWGILDMPYDSVHKIFYDHNWKICNDSNYIKFCRQYNYIPMRGLYKNESRKPRLYATNGNLSDNFQLFINKLLLYYNKEGLELSVLKHKDHSMLMKFNRKRKLEQINKNNGI